VNVNVIVNEWMNEIVIVNKTRCVLEAVINYYKKKP
jgi:hypothetical protein